MGRTTATDLPDTLDADGNTLTNITRSSYTLRGETAATWGAQTNPTFNIYDSQGRMSELRTYKALIGEPTAATPDSASTTWIYSPQRGFLTAKRDAENKGATYTYTPAGRLATRTWARGIVTTYTYDAGMLTLTDYSDTTPDVTAIYDNFGRVLSSSTLITSSTFAYDPAILVLDTETVSHDLNADGTPELTRVIDRTQDNLLRSTGFQLKDGTTIENQASYTYGATDGRLSEISNPQIPNSTFTYSYAPNSSLVASVTSPAHTVTNAWEATRDVLLSKENKAGATVVSDYGYTVNAIGQRTALSQSGSAFAAARSVDWGYDSLGQVVKADSTIPGLDRAYQYDLIGNRVKSADSLTLPAAPNYTTNALNQYATIDSLTPSYDDDGNATAYPLPTNLAANSTLVWDLENRMISSTVGATTTTYQYDAASRRIAKTTNGAATLYIYDGWNPIAEYSSPNLQSPISHVRSNLWGMDLSGSMQGAGGVGGLLLITDHSALANFFPTYDGNGNVSEYLNSTGAVVAHYEYDPFGRTTVATGAKAQDFAHRFSTKPLDAETGLYYYGYRYYDPVTGRWPSRDPIEEDGGVNLYGFVRNDGVGRVDVLGMAEEFWVDVDGPEFDNVMRAALRLTNETQTATFSVFDLSTTTEDEILKKTENKCAVLNYTNRIDATGKRIETLATLRLFDTEKEYEAYLKESTERVRKEMEAWEDVNKRLAAVTFLFSMRPPILAKPPVVGAGAQAALRPLGVSKFRLPAGATLDAAEGSVGIINMRVASGVGSMTGNFSAQGTTLFITQAHTAGKLTLRGSLELAKQLARSNGFQRVVIQGGKRTTGANPGHFPKPIVVSF